MLAGLCLGCGSLLELAAGSRLPRPLVVPAGLAVVILAAQFATLTDATAELSGPLVVALALAGLLLSPWWRPRPSPWAPAAAAGVFAVLAAPIVLSGRATFAGYIKLDDTATYLAMTDRVMEHGRSLAGLAPSTYEATLATTLAIGYPTASLMPLGLGHQLLAYDSVERVPLSMELYEEVRSNPRRFVVRPGHEVEAVERVVSAGDGYVIVEKTALAGQIAERTDPRT